MPAVDAAGLLVLVKQVLQDKQKTKAEAGMMLKTQQQVT